MSSCCGAYLLADNSQAEASKPMLMPCLLEMSGSTMSADLYCCIEAVERTLLEILDDLVCK